jgi:hypothetical protein
MLSNRGIKMKAFSLLIFLIFGSFVFQVQAMKPSGGAIGGAIPSLDVKKCDLKARGQSKLTVKDTSGKTHFLCLGMAVCEGKKKEVACEIREKDSCPTSQTCASVPVSRKDFMEIEGKCKMDFKTEEGIGLSIPAPEKLNCDIKQSLFDFYFINLRGRHDKVTQSVHSISNTERIDRPSSDPRFEFKIRRDHPLPTAWEPLYKLSTVINDFSYVEIDSDNTFQVFKIKEGEKKPGGTDLTFKLKLRGYSLTASPILEMEDKMKNKNLKIGEFVATGTYIAP